VTYPKRLKKYKYHAMLLMGLKYPILTRDHAFCAATLFVVSYLIFFIIKETISALQSFTLPDRLNNVV
jgi:hypothetical protein